MEIISKQSILKFQILSFDDHDSSASEKTLHLALHSLQSLVPVVLHSDQDSWDDRMLRAHIIPAGVVKTEQDTLKRKKIKSSLETSLRKEQQR